MKSKLTVKLLITFLALIMATSVFIPGCDEGPAEPPDASSAGDLSATLVPNVPLDIYAYAEQDSPTVMPAEMIGTPENIAIESLAIWGMPAGNDFVLGMGISLESAIDAAEIFSQITLDEDGWKKLSDRTIYVVQGNETAAAPMKTAIENNDFKQYDDAEAISAIAALPDSGTLKRAATGMAKPSAELIGFLTEDNDTEATGMANTILKLVRLKIVAAGLYSPKPIDIAHTIEVVDNGGDITELDIGVLVLVKSGLPGLLVKPAVEKLLEKAEFTETVIGGITVYKGYMENNGSGATSVLVRIEGNSIFAAIAGQESYAETLIMNISS